MLYSRQSGAHMKRLLQIQCMNGALNTILQARIQIEMLSVTLMTVKIGLFEELRWLGILETQRLERCLLRVQTSHPSCDNQHSV